MSGKGNLFASTPSALTLAWGIAAEQPPSAQNTVVIGVCHRRSITLVYGKPKSGKSFLATDLGLAVADPRRDLWMSHKIINHGPVIYVACEGEGGYWKRLIAAGGTPAQFGLATGRPVLIAESSRGYSFAPRPDDILEAVQAAQARFNCSPALIVIDTVFRSFGGGDVNSSSHMMAYVAAIGEIIARGIAVVLVHHATKGTGTPSGSVALMGAADTVIAVEQLEGNLHQWAVEQCKDDAATDPHQFRLELVKGITDAFGDEVSSCRVVPVGGPPKPHRANGKYPPSAAIGIRALEIALGKHGALLPPTPEWPANTAACTIDQWRSEYYALKGGTPATNRQAFNRAQDSLLASYAITQKGGLVWLVRRDAL